MKKKSIPRRRFPDLENSWASPENPSWTIFPVYPSEMMRKTRSLLKGIQQLVIKERGFIRCRGLLRIRIGDMGKSMWFLLTSLEDKPMNCVIYLTVIGKVGKLTASGVYKRWSCASVRRRWKRLWLCNSFVLRSLLNWFCLINSNSVHWYLIVLEVYTPSRASVVDWIFPIMTVKRSMPIRKARPNTNQNQSNRRASLASPAPPEHFERTRSGIKPNQRGQPEGSCHFTGAATTACS